MKISHTQKIILIIAACFLLLVGAVYFFDKGVAIGIFLLGLAVSATFAAAFKFNLKGKEFYLLLTAGLLVHLSAVLFIYFTGFRPVGGGADYELYHNVAQKIYYRFWDGNFSLNGLYLGHGFSLFIAMIYLLTIPEAIIANIFIVWFFVLSLIFIYLIVIEIGGSAKTAVLAGALAIIYPSYLYFGSLVLKDTIIVPLSLAAMLLSVKMIKKFSWIKFLVFFIVLSCLIQLRFYIGYAALFGFIISWFLASNLIFEKRVIFGTIMMFILGFSPLLSGGGYYGVYTIMSFLNPQKIYYYREVVYNPLAIKNNQANYSQSSCASQPPQNELPPKQTSCEDQLSEDNFPAPEGKGSSFLVKTGIENGFMAFSINSFESFLYNLFGPFPWQLKYKRQLISFIEVVPWYLLWVFFILGFTKFIKQKSFLEVFRHYRLCIPLLAFCLMAMGALSIFINNFGIATRIRIPVFICLLIMMFFTLNNNIENYYEKIFSYGRSWIHRLKSR
jgi:hypothetical protein